VTEREPHLRRGRRSYLTFGYQGSARAPDSCCLPSLNRYGARFDSCLAKVRSQIVVGRSGLILKPLQAHPDVQRHRVKFGEIQCIGEQVAASCYPSMDDPAVIVKTVDVHGHRLIIPRRGAQNNLSGLRLDRGAERPAQLSAGFLARLFLHGKDGLWRAFEPGFGNRMAAEI